MNENQTETIDVCVVGGGPAGLACAITAARAGAQVRVVEARDAVAHTIKPTGDGRCNVANAHTNAFAYRNPDFVRRVFVQCRPAEALHFLQGMGLLLREEAEGRLYPQANKSTSVIECLLAAARAAGVEWECGRTAVAVRRNAGAWTVGFPQGGRLRARAVAVCTGGVLPADFLPSAVPVHAFEPVLAPLACDPAPIRGLDKIRVKCALSAGDVQEVGEVQFRTYGISGICAFNLSRLVAPGDVVRLDFAPQVRENESMAFLRARLEQLDAPTWADFCTGLLLPQVARCVLQAAGLPEDARPGKHALEAFNGAWRSFPLEVRGVGDARLAQVRRGGVQVQAIDPHTMGVEGCPGLFCAGEAADVDGPCGGYNLHWAWASGIVAGRAAAKAGRP